MSLIHMVGFGYIAVYDNQTLHIVILETIFKSHIEDFKTFSKVVLQQE